jgi:hypothetical protein
LVMGRLYSQAEVDRLIQVAVREAIAPLLAKIAQLEAELARLKKNSSTSSKPRVVKKLRRPKNADFHRAFWPFSICVLRRGTSDGRPKLHKNRGFSGE